MTEFIQLRNGKVIQSASHVLHHQPRVKRTEEEKRLHRNAMARARRANMTEEQRAIERGNRQVYNETRRMLMSEAEKEVHRAKARARYHAKGPHAERHGMISEIAASPKGHEIAKEVKVIREGMAGVERRHHVSKYEAGKIANLNGVLTREDYKVEHFKLF